jgi:hypothetical protein
MTRKSHCSRDATAPELCQPPRHSENRRRPKREAKRRKAHANHVPRNISKRRRLLMYRRQVYAVCATHLLRGCAPYGARSPSGASTAVLAGTPIPTQLQAMLPGTRNQAGVTRPFFPKAEISMACKLRSGKQASHFPTAVHGIFAELANPEGNDMTISDRNRGSGDADRPTLVVSAHLFFDGVKNGGRQLVGRAVGKRVEAVLWHKRHRASKGPQSDAGAGYWGKGNRVKAFDSSATVLLSGTLGNQCLAKCGVRHSAISSLLAHLLRLRSCG